MTKRIVTHTGVVHATQGAIRSYGKLWPRPICGAGRSIQHFFIPLPDDEPVTCGRCLAKLAKEQVA